MTVQEMIDAGTVDVQICPPGRAQGIPRSNMREKPQGGTLAKRAAKYALSKKRHVRLNRN